MRCFDRVTVRSNCMVSLNHQSNLKTRTWRLRSMQQLDCTASVAVRHGSLPDTHILLVPLDASPEAATNVPFTILDLKEPAVWV